MPSNGKRRRRANSAKARQTKTNSSSSRKARTSPITTMQLNSASASASAASVVDYDYYLRVSENQLPSLYDTQRETCLGRTRVRSEWPFPLDLHMFVNQQFGIHHGWDLNLELVRKSDDTVVSDISRVPLKHVVEYGNGKLCTKQKVLQFLRRSEPVLVDGAANMRLRLTDVSRNHGKQNFVLRFESADPSVIKIEPLRMPAICVLSKAPRFKRRDSISKKVTGKSRKKPESKKATKLKLKKKSSVLGRSAEPKMTKKMKLSKGSEGFSNAKQSSRSRSNSFDCRASPRAVQVRGRGRSYSAGHEGEMKSESTVKKSGPQRQVSPFLTYNNNHVFTFSPFQPHVSPLLTPLNGAQFATFNSFRLPPAQQHAFDMHHAYNKQAQADDIDVAGILAGLQTTKCAAINISCGDSGDSTEEYPESSSGSTSSSFSNNSFSNWSAGKINENTKPTAADLFCDGNTKAAVPASASSFLDFAATSGSVRQR